MPMLDTISSNDFAACLNQPFQIHYGVPQPIEVTLIEVSVNNKQSPIGDRQPFSLIFLCTQELGGSAASYLQQGTYPIAHSTLGTLDLFIVPIGPGQTSGGMQYQAIFS